MKTKKIIFLLYVIIALFIERRMVITTYNIIKFGGSKTPAISKKLNIVVLADKNILLYNTNNENRLYSPKLFFLNIVLISIILSDKFIFLYFSIPRGQP